MRVLGRALVVVVALAACSSEPAPITAAEYLADLEAVCAEVTGELEALPRPPEAIAAADFATSAASALTNEAERMRRLDPPSELAADHRAIVRNTDDQASAWRTIAADTGDLGSVTTHIGELVRGRNDLADEMGAPGCRRGDV